RARAWPASLRTRRALAQLPATTDRNAAVLAIYMCKLLAQLNFTLRTKSEQYPEALKAIFLLNNTVYLLQGLQRSGLLDLLSLAEREVATNYRDMVNEHKACLPRKVWNKLLAHIVLEEPLPAKLRGSRPAAASRINLRRSIASGKKAARAQVCYSVPDAELREELKRSNKQALLPRYTAFYDSCAHLPLLQEP
ncbi:hypothetical protein ACJJTC_011338, partial [Scirpophaga incertulas]